MRSEKAGRAGLCPWARLLWPPAAPTQKGTPQASAHDARVRSSHWSNVASDRAEAGTQRLLGPGRLQGQPVGSSVMRQAWAQAPRTHVSLKPEHMPPSPKKTSVRVSGGPCARAHAWASAALAPGPGKSSEHESLVPQGRRRPSRWGPSRPSVEKRAFRFVFIILTVLSIWLGRVQHIRLPEPRISTHFSSCKTETPYSLNDSAPSSPQLPVTTVPLSIFTNVPALGTSGQRKHTEFVFSGLASFTWHKVPEVHP